MKSVRLNVLVSPKALEKADKLAALMGQSRAKAITELLEWMDPHREAADYFEAQARGVIDARNEQLQRKV